MGFRFRKSINLGGGFRANLSKSGVGYSWGTKGVRFTKTAKGTTRKTLSIPGTGLSYTTESSSKSTHSTSNNRIENNTTMITDRSSTLKNGRFTNFIKKHWRWLLTGLTALLFLSYFPSFSSFVFLLVTALIAPIAKWQTILSKYIKGKLRKILAGILAVIALVATPSTGNAPADNTPEAPTAIVAESTEPPHIHEFLPASCTQAKTCSSCGETEGEALGHTWVDATCLKVKHCSDCGFEEGELGEHAWNEATCEVAKTCSVCNNTEGDPIEHTWEEATCQKAKTCSACGKREGMALEHAYQNAVCVNCGENEPTVWIPNSGSKYHSRSGCSNMKNPSEVPISTAIAWGYEPCSKC